ncbi:UNVERIFIED_CONTAM: hypothetical protein Scaly_2980600 [Sesamum calycinum]|uniref:Tf2-1-like SH3-like domain-containing protein n=1 Tax=Sesamum calycinum TaxID=2727403 RepID=A0AAW2KL25_9LAMI
MEYEVGEKVFLKVSSWKGILRFGKQEKLSTRCIGPYEILERVGLLAYRLVLSAELSQIHDVFHVSMLRRYRSDASHILREPKIEVSEGLTYVEELIEILDRSIKKLRNKEISMVTVRWSHHSPREATWEVEEKMREKYSYLFPELIMSKNPLTVILDNNKINGTNYSDWLHNLRIILDYKNQRYIMDKPLPQTLPAGSSSEERETFERWLDDVASILQRMKEVYAIPERHTSGNGQGKEKDGYSAAVEGKRYAPIIVRKGIGRGIVRVYLPIKVLQRSKKLSKNDVVLRLGDGKAVAVEDEGIINLVISDPIKLELKD